MTDDERLDAVQWRVLKEMVVTSGVDDLVPGEPMRVRDDLGVYVQSQARGAVRIGTYPTWPAISQAAALLTDDQLREYLLGHRLPASEMAFEVIRQHAEELEAKRRKTG